MPELVITIATKADLTEITTIGLDCLPGFWSEAGYLAEFDSPNSQIFVVRSNDRVLGFGCLWLILEECHIVMVAITPEYQNQSLGKALTWSMLDFAHTTRSEWIVLEVRESNTNAIGLYQYFGFKEIGKRKGYYANENALVMWCKDVNHPTFKQKLDREKIIINQKLTDRGWVWLSSEGIKEIKNS